MRIEFWISAKAFQEHLTDDFASCRPVYDIYHGISITLCDNLITPLNGIWTALGIALFFLLPLLVLFKLMTTYLRKKKYSPVQYEEEEADDDEFPLRPPSRRGNNVIYINKKNGLKKRRAKMLFNDYFFL